MHDVRLIRKAPDLFDRALVRRGADACSEAILRLDREMRAALALKQQAQTARNDASRQIGRAKNNGGAGETEALKAKAIEAGKIIAVEGDKADAAGQKLTALLSSIPNILHEEIPDGADASNNRQIRIWGEKPVFDFEPAHHADLGAALTTPDGFPGMDFRSAARISGARFVVLRGAMAKLERALTQFMLDMHVGKHGYEEIAPPVLAGHDALYGTGQLPKFADDLFACGDGFYAVSTAEIPLANLVREQILSQRQLPLRLCAATPCFRAEAGAAGRDARGMIRLHQFMKTELVSIVAPGDADTELERMTTCAEAVLKQLNLPYRVVELCAGDTGFSARRTYDLEVWMPSENKYREISSCSDCGDFQARRMNARYRPDAGGAPVFVHSLNGSALAVGRTMAALIENGQRKDGSVRLPEALASFMGADEIKAFYDKTNPDNQ